MRAPRHYDIGVSFHAAPHLAGRMHAGLRSCRKDHPSHRWLRPATVPSGPPDSRLVLTVACYNGSTVSPPSGVMRCSSSSIPISRINMLTVLLSMKIPFPECVPGCTKYNPYHSRQYQFHNLPLPVLAHVSIEDPHFSLWMIHAAGRIIAGVKIAERLSLQRISIQSLGRGALILLRQPDEYILRPTLRRLPRSSAISTLASNRAIDEPTVLILASPVRLEPTGIIRHF